MISPPLGLGYIAAVLEKQGYEVKILDCNLRYSTHNLKQQFDCWADVVGITSMSCNYHYAIQLAKMVKQVDRRKVTVLGGPHPTAMAQQVLAEKCVDYVVQGEGEFTTLKLIECLEGRGDLSKIDGIAYRKSDQVIVQPKNSHIEELDSLPYPAYHLLSLDKYQDAPHGVFFERKPFLPMFTSRGCPYQCKFCANPAIWGHVWRARSAKNIVDEINYLVDKFNVKEIHFEDDNFTLDRNRLIEICNRILESGLDIAWKCPNGVRFEGLDLDVLKLMRKSGCYSLSFGIESGVQKILEGVNKKMRLGLVKKVIEEARKAGISTVGFFIIGLPGETVETARQTIRFAKSLKLTAAQFNIFVPFPGTAIFDEYIRKGYISKLDWRKFSVDYPVFETESLRSDEIRSLRRQAFREFYLRPKVLLENLRHISSVRGFLWLIRRLGHVFQDSCAY